MNHRRFLVYVLLASLLLTSASLPALAADLEHPAQQTTTCDQVTLHYRRTNADYDGWGLHVWGPTLESVSWEAPLEPAGEDDYGLYWVVDMNQGAALLNYIVHKGDEKDPGPDQVLNFDENGCEIWLVQGRETQFRDPETALEALLPVVSAAPSDGEDQVILHYTRTSGDYDGWGLHVWGPTAEEGVTWGTPLLPAGQDDYGLYWVVDMEPGADVLNYIVHKGDEKDPGPDQSLDIAALGNEIWLIQGSGEQFTDPELALQALLIANVGDITNKAQAHWVAADTIAWPLAFGPKATYLLYYDPDGAIQVTEQGLQGGQTITLEFVDRNLSPELQARFPHLDRSIMLKIPDEYLDRVPDILKGQYAVTVSLDDEILGATALQIPGALDDLYAYDGPLGVSWEGDTPTLRLWAPTARSVTLHLFPDADPNTSSRTFSMNWDTDTGVWSLTGEPGWKNQFYLYEVEVYVRQEGGVVRNLVTDPYSFGLAQNSRRSQLVDLNDPALKPDGWDDYPKPSLAVPEDIVLYELHLRDFSSHDPSLPAEHQGTFMAFTHPDSNGMQHLRRLAEAGVSHVHMLPLFDIATINENKAEWMSPDFDELAGYPPNAPDQQAAINAVRDQDGFNWGYDPYHYTVPEGSYATNPDGPARILEFRHMVMALNQTGLRLVMDVVYNHTNAAGQGERSVLDRIVPGYYYRLDENGNVTTSTCCPNTATEHAMMEKLMLDSLLTWARAYKVDGFRFDLMGHHMKANMEAVRAELDNLSLAEDGVDGPSIYVYGEGWNFGEVADDARGINATQLNLPGTGIGTFNDRLRDAARGGNPFGGLQEQGFVTGLYVDPNQVDARPEETQRASLLALSDNVRIGLAGNLADYQLLNAEGDLVSGAELDYNGAPAGYTLDPQENIVYVSAHDNETLFDAIQYKAPLDTSMEERVRMQNLGISLVALSQGVPFFHAGTELLRSKSLDRDSYNSGDWFNALDFTYQSNNWGKGLPVEDKNGSNWPLMSDLLGREELAPSQEHILTSLQHLEEMLRIRFSSPLFRLQSGAEVMERVRFHNTGPDQIPGLIVMSISDDGPAQLDDTYDLIVVLFNADDDPQTITLADLPDFNLALHPVQAGSADPLVATASFDAGSQTFDVPGRTTAVFVGPETPDEPAPAEATPEAPASTPETEAPTAEPEAEDGGTSPWILVLVAVGLAGLVGGGLYSLRRRR